MSARSKMQLSEAMRAHSLYLSPSREPQPPGLAMRLREKKIEINKINK
jgi:hypothetical protein